MHVLGPSKSGEPLKLSLSLSLSSSLEPGFDPIGLLYSYSRATLQIKIGP